jgi:hypothetical protein
MHVPRLASHVLGGLVACNQSRHDERHHVILNIAQG